MATIQTKFSVGDVVWRAGTTTKKHQHPCPDCLGSRKWTATSPAGKSFEVSCPRCGGGYQSNRDLSLDYTLFAPFVERLTIGSVRTNTEDETEYMCRETGVGSGSVYRERDMFATREGAKAAAKIKADLNNQGGVAWVAKQYDHIAKFCDYELKDAAIKSANDQRVRISVRTQMLLEDLDAAETINDVRRAVTAWREAANKVETV